MSFPRAKVPRFNDVKPLTSSTAEYNPVINSTPKGAVIPQNRRFDKSPTRSESDMQLQEFKQKYESNMLKNYISNNINKYENLMKETKVRDKKLVKDVLELKALQLTIKNINQEMVENVLFLSRREVERLNQEISKREKKILDLENNSQRLTCELKQQQEYNKELENVTYKNKINKQNQQYEELLKKFKALEEENERNKQTIEEQRSLIEPYKEKARDIQSKYVDIRRFPVDCVCA